MATTTTFYNRTKTATADTPFQIDTSPHLTLSSFNIYCYTNACYLGNQGSQNGVILPNAVVWYDKPVKVSDLWFKNYTAGSNTVVVVQGTILVE